MVRAALALAVLLFAPTVAVAEEYAPLGEVVVAYDPAVWKVTELSGVAALTFRCIATDCAGEPGVFATATDVSADTAPDDGTDSRPITDPHAPTDNGITFTATGNWSGCRASDAEILSAVGIVGGTRYWFTTALGTGCNHQPEMPEGRFLELLYGVTAIGPE